MLSSCNESLLQTGFKGALKAKANTITYSCKNSYLFLLAGCLIPDLISPFLSPNT